MLSHVAQLDLPPVYIVTNLFYDKARRSWTFNRERIRGNKTINTFFQYSRILSIYEFYKLNCGKYLYVATSGAEFCRKLGLLSSYMHIKSVVTVVDQWSCFRIYWPSQRRFPGGQWSENFKPWSAKRMRNQARKTLKGAFIKTDLFTRARINQSNYILYKYRVVYGLVPTVHWNDNQSFLINIEWINQPTLILLTVLLKNPILSSG